MELSHACIILGFVIATMIFIIILLTNECTNYKNHRRKRSPNTYDNRIDPKMLETKKEYYYLTHTNTMADGPDEDGYFEN